MNRFRLVMGTAVALAALLAACGRKAPPNYLVLGTNAEFPPFASRDGEPGAEVRGFDVEVARAIAEKAGRPLKIVDMEFDRLLPALAAGEVDLVLAGLTITPERSASVAFSEAYYQATQTVLLLAGAPVPETRDDLKGLKLGAQAGSTGAGLAVEIAGEANVRMYPSAKDAVVALMNSRVEAVLLDQQPSVNFLKINPELMRVPLDFAAEFYGVAVRPDNAELLATVNAALADIRADGRYDRWVHEWLVRMIDIRAAAAEEDADE
jgi:arginine/lysine/histidine transporter system substrate-binding protein